MARALTVLCLLAAPGLVSCEQQTYDSSLVWVQPPQAVEKLNSPAGVFSRATRGVFVDTRNARQFAEGHIPDAISLPLPEMEESAASALAGYDLFIVYDSDFTDVMAKAGSKRLIELGYSNVFTLEGGLKAWKKEGYDVATGPPKQPGTDTATAGAQP